MNPQNRFEQTGHHVLGEHLDELIREAAMSRDLDDPATNSRCVALPLRTVATTILHDHSRTIINRVTDSPDLGFEWTVNPYRGCEHGCIYCYARPTHEYLGFSCGLDFETKIMAKHDAPDMLRRELAHPRWKPQAIVFSGVTDCYQPIEAQLQITRRLLQVCAEFRQPVSIVTKNHLVTRDIDLLRDLASHSAAHVYVSVTTLHNDLAAKMEPRASAPRDRLKAIRELRDAGVPVGVMTAPIIPGLNDKEIPSLLEAAKRAGAKSAAWVMLRLPYQLKALFMEWLARELPEKASRVEHLIREVRGGALSDPRFGARMRGEGETAEIIKKLFNVHAKRLGLNSALPSLSAAAFRRPELQDRQLHLFE